ncbi:MAG: hypothetical protein ACLGG7_13965, partial [Bacteriovoracia bacterium]
MKFLKFSVVLVLAGLAPVSHAIECEWWQTPVDGSTIPQHPRSGRIVKKHPRKEHCRERWKGANKFIRQFENHAIKGWPHKENFKMWKKSEIGELLGVLSSLPSWTQIEEYRFYRSSRSEIEDNPARSEITKKS